MPASLSAGAHPRLLQHIITTPTLGAVSHSQGLLIWLPFKLTCASTQTRKSRSWVPRARMLALPAQLLLLLAGGGGDHINSQTGSMPLL